MPQQLTFRTTAEALEAIEAGLKQHPTPPSTNLIELPVDDIVVCEAAFQRRDLSDNHYEREEHIRTLAKAIGDKKNPQYLDAITIWWGGSGWFLLDGHHRVSAYAKVGMSGAIPIRVFSGSFEDAIGHTAEANSRNKLPMSNDEKMNSAVDLICMTSLSRQEIADKSGASRTTVGTIRRTIGELEAKGRLRINLADHTWKEIQLLNNGDDKLEAYDHDQVTREKAKAIREALGPIIKKNPLSSADAIALALGQISNSLQQSISESFHWDVQHWSDPEDAEY